MIYVGEWKPDLGKHGEGELIFGSGTSMHGFFSDDKANGYGELRGYYIHL